MALDGWKAAAKSSRAPRTISNGARRRSAEQSGGPEFGQQPSHALNTPPSEAFGGNILISSTSYTYSTNVQVDGGSIPGQFGGSLNTFGDLLNAARTTGNC
jgi:hypothetical protein